MAGVRFDEAFLAEQIEKRKKWAKKGHLAGHGGKYNLGIDQDLNHENTIQKLKRSTQSTTAKKIDNKPSPVVSGRYLDVLRQGIDTTDLPDWLIDIINTDDEIAVALTSGKGNLPDSPHKQALVSLIKDYSLLTGRPATATSKAQKGNPEHYIQVRIFYQLERDYEFEYYFVKSVPNGGLRAKKTRFTMQAEGQKRGAHDIDVDLPRGKYHGMKLEVKTESGVVSKEQQERLDRLNEYGYYCVVGKGFEECWSQLTAYFKLGAFDNITAIEK